MARVLVVDDSPTILRIVEAVLVGADIEVFVAHSGDEGLALALEHKPDLILLDQVMPRMTGYQFCQQLAGQDQAHIIPVVMMTSKGDPGSDRFINAPNVVDYVSKPFSPEVIHSITVHTLEKHRPVTAEAKATSAGDEDLPDELHFTSAESPAATATATTDAEPEPEPDKPELSWEESPLANEAAAVIRAKEAERALKEITRDLELDDEITLVVDADESGPDRTLEVTHPSPMRAHEEEDETQITDMPPDDDALHAGSSDGAILWAELGQVPLPELLQLLQLQSHTGLFRVWSPRSSFDIFIKRGRVRATQARGADQELRLGRFLVSRELIGSTELEQLARSASGGSGLPLGEKLVRLGHIRADQLRDALADQCRELFYEALRVRVGRCALYPGVQPPPEFDAMLVDLEVPGLLLEGMRRVDEWSVIEREVKSFDTVFELRRSGMTDPADLTSNERRLLMLVDGQRSVRDLVNTARLRPFEACKMLYRLAATRHIQRINTNNAPRHDAPELSPENP